MRSKFLRKDGLKQEETCCPVEKDLGGDCIYGYRYNAIHRYDAEPGYTLWAFSIEDFFIELSLLA